METEVSDLRRMIGYLEEFEAWKVLRYPSLGMLLFRECELSADDLEAIKQAQPGQPVPVVLGPHGGDRKSGRAKLDQSDVITLIRGTTGSPYLIARLRRDYPAILARLEAGEFPSVRAAARAAGIVRPTAMFYTDSPSDAARALKRHFQGERLEALIRELGTQS